MVAKKKKKTKADKRFARKKKKPDGPPIIHIRVPLHEIDDFIAAFRTCALPAAKANAYADHLINAKHQALGLGGKSNDKNKT